MVAIPVPVLLEGGYSEGGPHARSGILGNRGFDRLRSGDGAQSHTDGGVPSRVCRHRCRVYLCIRDCSLETEYQRDLGDRPPGCIGHLRHQGLGQAAANRCLLAVTRDGRQLDGSAVIGQGEIAPGAGEHRQAESWTEYPGQRQDGTHKNPPDSLSKAFDLTIMS